MTYLTLFTAPKPFVNPHIDMIQRNALKSWLALGDQVEVVMVGDENGMAEVAEELGIRYLPNVKTNAYGTPLLSSIFVLARNVSESPFLAYVNTDILILSGMLEALRKIAEQKSEFLVIGQRWDLDITEAMDFEKVWQNDLTRSIKARGELHAKAGSDYFIYPRTCFLNIPEFAVGRAGWDNWMIYHARKEHWGVIDATEAIRIVHQKHDYSHLPGGQPHHKLPETDENVRLAGGKHTVFTLEDADFVFNGRKVKHASLSWKKFWREVEIFPMITLKSNFLTNISFALFHPQSAYADVRRWLSSYKQRRKAG